MEKEKVPLKAKRRKKEEEEGVLYSSNTDTLMTQVKQVDTLVCGMNIEIEMFGSVVEHLILIGQ